MIGYTVLRKVGDEMNLAELIDKLLFFVVLSAVVTMSSQVLKNLAREYSGKESGIFISVALGIIVAFSSQLGLICTVYWCEAAKVEIVPKVIPPLFKNADLLMTGLLYSLSSEKIISLHKEIQDAKTKMHSKNSQVKKTKRLVKVTK